MVTIKHLTVLITYLVLSSCGTEAFHQRPFYDWYTGKVVDGNKPDLSCPSGRYRDKTVGLRSDGCIKCPFGTYSNRTDLLSKEECTPCPLGTYRDELGGKEVQSCKYCPRGTYGEEIGLKSRECSGHCSVLNYGVIRYYSTERGLDSREGCKVCPYFWNSGDGQCIVMPQSMQNTRDIFSP